MINPMRLQAYNRTPQELQEFMIYSIMSWGRRSFQVAEVVNDMLRGESEPFEFIQELAESSLLEVVLRGYKCLKGKILLEGALSDVAYANIDIASAAPMDILNIPGLTPKVVSFYLRYTDPIYYEDIIVDGMGIKMLNAAGQNYRASDILKYDKYSEASMLLGELFLEEDQDLLYAEFFCGYGSGGGSET